MKRYSTLEPFALVIFGITGNLAQSKLIPALYDLAKNNLLPSKFKIIGIGRKPYTKETFEKYLHDTLHAHRHHSFNDTLYKNLCSKLTYLNHSFQEEVLYKKIKKETGNMNRLFYLATYPEHYALIFQKLKEYQLHEEEKDWSRIIIEKPLGTDLSSAQALNNLLLSYFSEKQIYRLDHYLGKETLQNILTFRFSNTLFEPLLTSEYIDHIQITSAEELGIADRGGYYDSVGALKDVGQNHLLQMLALATMNCPKHFTNEAITKERLNVLTHIASQPNSLVLGQYTGYSKEKNVNPKSQIDTFFAFKTSLTTNTLQNIPVYIRGGKKLARSVSEIIIVFKKTKTPMAHDIFGQEPNALIYRISPNEGIIIKMLVKSPGHTNAVEPAYMQFCYKQLQKDLPTAYEKLLFDVMEGDQTFFNDAAEVEAQWKFIDALIDGQKKPFIYEPGSWGPKEADEMIEKDGRIWIEPSTEFCNF